MAKEKGFYLSIKDGDRGDDTEAFIRAALEHEGILLWAYILHDKEYYNEHDMNIRRFGLQHDWADGFPEMENYASAEEYIEEYMNKPPYLGDKKPNRWCMVCIVASTVTGADFAKWFGAQEHFPRPIDGRYWISEALKDLTGENKHQQALDRPIYPDEEVQANFDFRDYITNTKEPVSKRTRDGFWKRWADIFWKKKD
ncbi:MAG: hypothetical protein IKS10_00750 [Lachnospiraceae bacterium]|nr:hypothetical protein [Lachnospiraceae bacterium]